MEEITIGKEEFKALSSDTRISIIKLLDERNYTLSEISSKLNMSSPTIKQHLETLVNSDLIQQKDEGRKWKYYCLTKKGKKIITPESNKIMILLAASLIGIVFLAYLLTGTGMSSRNYDSTMDSFNAPQKMMASEAGSVSDYLTENQPNEQNQYTALITALIAVSFTAGFLLAKTKKTGI